MKSKRKKRAARIVGIVLATFCSILILATVALVIYINKKHQNAPTEAIACLIAHESQHHTQTGTKQEEIRAWVKETSTWNAFVRKNPTIVQSNSPLVKRENYINKVYLADNQGSKGIEKVVSGIAMYRGLN